MNDIGDRQEEFLKETDDLVEKLGAIDHPCRLCPMVEDMRAMLYLLPRYKLYKEMTAQDDHEYLSEQVEYIFEGSERENGVPPSKEEIRKRLGSILSDNLGLIDEDIESVKNELEDMSGQCEGIISLMLERNGRRIGVIACGSNVLPDGDNVIEGAFVTRYTLP